MTSDFLKISYIENDGQTQTAEQYEYRNQPFSNSKIFCAKIKNFKNLTRGADVKTTYQINFSLKEIDYEFLPGDSIAILPQNDNAEVNELFIRLNLEAKCDKKYKLELLKETAKKNPVIPKHIPPSSTLRDVFLKNIDIRAAPKKTFLKRLIKCTSDTSEKEKLEVICSTKGSREYEKLLTEHQSLLSLLNGFPSCFPPVEVIFEHSAPLNPRYFSVASSPLEKNVLSIIFSVIQHQNGLKGVCTGWLEKCIQKDASVGEVVPFYFRKPGNFRLSNLDNPIVLIATGTGIAPFRGILQHKKIFKEVDNDIGPTWLFYGCRYSRRDFLCSEELENYLKDGVLTKLYTAFSRDTEEKVYVQKRMVENGEHIVDLILNKNAFLFICGDAKTVVKDVKAAITQCFMVHRNIKRYAAEDIVSDLVKNKRYLLDSWI